MKIVQKIYYALFMAALSPPAYGRRHRESGPEKHCQADGKMFCVKPPFTPPLECTTGDGDEPTTALERGVNLVEQAAIKLLTYYRFWSLGQLIVLPHRSNSFILQ